MKTAPSRTWRILWGVLTVFLLSAAAIVGDGLTDELARADVGLVLGSKVNPDGKLSERLSARLDQTLVLYQGGYFPLIVVSGATGTEGHDEALAMKRYLSDKGVPPDQILVDSDGVTTYASARNLRSTLRERNLNSVLVITQYFHVPRSKLALKRFGIGPVYSSHARFFEIRDFYSIAREIAGYVRYATRSYQ